MNPETTNQSNNPPQIKIRIIRDKTDLATALGFFFALSLIGIALYLGGNIQSFFNIPSILIVLGGTVAVTLISFSLEDFKSLPTIIGRALLQKDMNIKQRMRELLELSAIAKKHGVLSLQKIESNLRGDKFLHRAIQFASDGYTANDIQRLLAGEIEALKKRHEQSANIVHKASEVAPAMGLIGTLIGLVQMLAQLDDPSAIGPSMAVALLTTFYGAFLGTVVLSPLATKLEKNSVVEMVEKKLILIAVTSIAKHEHPRRLEMQLNSEVAPYDRIIYFDDIKS